jgi:hypothetical protein
MQYRFTHRVPAFLLSAVLLLGSTVSVPAASNPAPSIPTAAERTAACQKFTTERLAVWQRRLNLSQWNISVLMSRTSDLKPKTLGNIHWDADHHSAVIRVLDPADYQLPHQAMLEDMEFTVVHELLHLELSSLPKSDASRSDEEHAVNQIAAALLKLDRGH